MKLLLLIGNVCLYKHQQGTDTVFSIILNYINNFWSTLNIVAGEVFHTVPLVTIIILISDRWNYSNNIANHLNASSLFNSNDKYFLYVNKSIILLRVPPFILLQNNHFPKVCIQSYLQISYMIGLSRNECKEFD